MKKNRKGRKKFTGFALVLSLFSFLLSGCSPYDIPDLQVKSVRSVTEGWHRHREPAGVLTAQNLPEESGEEPAEDAAHKNVEMEMSEGENAVEGAETASGFGENGDAGEKKEERPEYKADMDGLVMRNAGHYGYDLLNERQREWYREIVEILGNMEKDVKLSYDGNVDNPDEADMDLLFQCVMMDHPEMFYVEGYGIERIFVGGYPMEIYFSGTYVLTVEDAFERLAYIEEAALKILEGMPNDASDYEKVKYVYDTVILNTEYNLSAPDNQNLYSVLVRHSSVCQGYSEAVQYLLLCAGVDCTIVQGEVDGGESHAWNLVKADGDYYYLDVTWGDASYSQDAGGENADGGLSINYDYFCITTDELLRRHRLSRPEWMPYCTATQDNYYVRENLVFSEYDMDRMKEIYERTLAEGRRVVSVKASDSGCFWELYYNFIEDEKIFECVPQNIRELNYAYNDDQYVLTFW